MKIPLRVLLAGLILPAVPRAVAELDLTIFDGSGTPTAEAGEEGDPADGAPGESADAEGDAPDAPPQPGEGINDVEQDEAEGEPGDEGVEELDDAEEETEGEPGDAGQEEPDEEGEEAAETLPDTEPETDDVHRDTPLPPGMEDPEMDFPDTPEDEGDPFENDDDLPADIDGDVSTLPPEPPGGRGGEEVQTREQVLPGQMIDYPWDI